jgi:hypothetical protein
MQLLHPSMGMGLAVDAHFRTNAALLPEGEAAMRGALRFIAKHVGPDGAGDLQVWGLKGREAGRLLPVGGADGVGPGHRNHAWLAELAALRGPVRLLLAGWQLSAQDIAALSQLRTVETLSLDSRIPLVGALPLLARCPALTALYMDVGHVLGCARNWGSWQEGHPGGAAQLRAAMLALFFGVGWQGTAEMFAETCSRDAAGVLRGLLRDLRAAGIADSRIAIFDAWED